MKIVKAEIEEVESNHIQYKRFMRHPNCNVLDKSISAIAVTHDLSFSVVEVVGERFCVSRGEDYDPKCIIIGLTPEVEEALGFFMSDYRETKRVNEKYFYANGDLNRRLRRVNQRGFFRRLVDAFSGAKF